MHKKPPPSSAEIIHPEVSLFTYVCLKLSRRVWDALYSLLYTLTYISRTGHRKVGKYPSFIGLQTLIRNSYVLQKLLTQFSHYKFISKLLSESVPVTELVS